MASLAIRFPVYVTQPQRMDVGTLDIDLNLVVNHDTGGKVESVGVVVVGSPTLTEERKNVRRAAQIKQPIYVDTIDGRKAIGELTP